MSEQATHHTDEPEQVNNGLGAVFTRRWAADLVLDLAGYTAPKDLAAKRVTEPSCGSGAFLIPMIDRLATSCALHNTDLAKTDAAIRAWDLDEVSVQAARTNTQNALKRHGLTTGEATRLARTWVKHGDFLLNDCEPTDWIVGNPPYVRLEEIPTTRSQAYRQKWETMRGRADVYVGFIEAGLKALKPDGVLAFICADRWMRNQYGKHLRQLVDDHFAVDAIVTLHDSDAFEERVSAYPAVFTIRAGEQNKVLIVDANADFGADAAAAVVDQYNAGPKATTRPVLDTSFTSAWTLRWEPGAASWPTGPAHRVSMVTDLERRFPALGDTESHTRLGIGLATGADQIYLTRDPELVEPEQMLPMVMAGDLHDGKVVWTGTHLVSPWSIDQDAEPLVDLQDFPRLAKYYRKHKSRLLKRHVADRQPEKWIRTIDRPIPGLATQPKLLLPDLRQRVAPVLENEGLYPHHNLFWITSDTWDLRVLGGLLLSDFGTLFVETYSPRMAGGALRITAQYLRRVRIPDPSTIPATAKKGLATAFDKRDVAGATIIAASLYGVDVDALR